MRPSNLQAGWRGLVPLVVVGTVALVVAGSLTAGASGLLPARTAAQLLADLDRVDVGGYSGTVVQKSTLLDADQLTVSGLSLARLLSGSNTIKVWYGGPDKQRIAVLDATGESDVFRDGTQVWQWDSTTKVATQSTASATTSTTGTGIPVDGTTVTPDDLARRTVAAIGPGTHVSVSTQTSVAGRPAYQLVVTPPTSSTTRIGQVVLALDGATRMPLAAKVYARGVTREAAIDLSFQHIAFEPPDDDAFTFVPPPGSVIRAYDAADTRLTANPDPLLGSQQTVTRGSGWTRVAIITSLELLATKGAAATVQFGQVLTPVSGTWGSGQLLQTRNGLLSMLFVSDGRIVVGAVAPSELYAALEQ